MRSFDIRTPDRRSGSPEISYRSLYAFLCWGVRSEFVVFIAYPNLPRNVLQGPSLAPGLSRQAVDRKSLPGMQLTPPELPCDFERVNF
jgi:hypothetical protein